MSADATRSYGRGAAILSVGIGVTGLVTYGYFALASHNLSREDYGGITLLWSAVFITVSVLYRPVEQLLSHTIADHQARGQEIRRPMQIAATIQLGLGILFATLALLLQDPIQNDLFSGSSTLCWVLLSTVLAYAVSYFARGWLAGHRHFGLYGLLVFIEATSRIAFPIAVAIGIATGQSPIALGILAAPLISLLIVPWAFKRQGKSPPPAGGPGDGPLRTGPQPAPPARTQHAEGVLPPGQAPRPTGPSLDSEFTLAHGTGFATAVLLIMLAEQTFLNAGPLLIKATEGAAGAALAGFVFNVLLIARAPLQLFQSISTSLLPHLTGLRAGGEAEGEATFRHSIRVTMLAIAGFALSVAAVMAAAGPWLMELFFGAKFDYDRLGLVIVAVGMGLYLSAATLNQAALARGRARAAAGCWIAAAAGFVTWILVPGIEPVLRVEAGFTLAAAALCALLYALYRAPTASAIRE